METIKLESYLTVIVNNFENIHIYASNPLDKYFNEIIKK